jgi:hypothetical protein
MNPRSRSVAMLSFGVMGASATRESPQRHSQVEF